MNQDTPTQYETLPPSATPVSQPVMGPIYRPYVTFILIGICVGVYLLQLATQSFFNIDIPEAWGVKNNTLIMQGQVWRFITPIFLHGSIVHLGFNMYALFALGPTLERFYRRWRYLVLFLLGGFAGNVLSFMFTKNPSLGASTAIFGLLGAEGVLIYQNREIFGPTARRALSQVVIIAVINLVIGLSTPAIDIWGHIGGLIGGTIFAWFGGPLLQRQGFYPPYTLKDVRTSREVIIAGVGVGGLFSFLAIAAMFLQKG
jgi:rhomboid protease GluP